MPWNEPLWRMGIVENLAYRPAEANDVAYLLRLEEADMRRHAEALWGRWRPSATVETYDISGHRIILVLGRPVGCLATTCRPDGITIRRLFIAAEHQNRGIGTAALRDVVSRAERAGVPVRLSVLTTNPALRLYEREDFTLEAETTERRHLVRISRT